jgi:uncharacterized protein
MKSRARVHLLVFLAVVFTLSFAVEGAILHAGGLRAVGAWPVFALMWTPGLVALGMRLVWRRELPASGWRLPRPKWLLIAFLLPPLVALFGYGLGWLSGLAPLEVPWERVAAKVAPGLLGLAGVVAIAATLGIAVGSVFALGEEIGWRGLMVPLLIRAGVPAPFAVSGFIWGLWHLPLVVFGDYATSSLPLVSAALFVLATTVDGINYGWLRMASASLWPAMLLHASHNAFFQQVFDKLTGSSATSPFVVGESGVLPILFYFIVAAWLVLTGRSKRAILAATSEAGAAPEPQEVGFSS